MQLQNSKNLNRYSFSQVKMKVLQGVIEKNSCRDNKSKIYIR